MEKASYSVAQMNWIFVLIEWMKFPMNLNEAAIMGETRGTLLLNKVKVVKVIIEEGWYLWLKN